VRTWPSTAPEQQEIIEHTVGAIQRIAMYIVTLPREQRSEQYAVVRGNFAESIKKFGVEGKAADKWLNLTMQGIEALVSEIEAGGGAAGGKA
jgi:hypothetical protein